MRQFSIFNLIETHRDAFKVLDSILGVYQDLGSISGTGSYHYSYRKHINKIQNN